MDKLKLVGLAGAGVLILNVIFFSFRLITPLMFWLVIIASAMFAYLILPRWKK